MIPQGKNQFEDVDREIRVYAEKIEALGHVKVIQSDLTYSSFFQNKMLIIHSIRRGLPYKLFNFIKMLTPFTEEDWASYLNLSVKSLQRYKKEKEYLFKPIHTEKIIELAEVTNFGNQVFDSNDQFYTWLNTPSYALGNLKPAELLNDSYGKELVMAELNRIEQGIFV